MASGPPTRPWVGASQRIFKKHEGNKEKFTNEQMRWLRMIKDHKKKVELDIEYSDDSIFYNIIFKKERLAETTQKIKTIGDKDDFQDTFGINLKEFRNK